MSGTDGSGDFVAGFFWGALVGAAAALLFAPFPGEETRRLLREKSGEMKSRAECMGVDVDGVPETIRTRGQAILETQRSRLQEAIREGRQAAEAKRSEMLNRLHDAQATGEEPTPPPPYVGPA